MEAVGLVLQEQKFSTASVSAAPPLCPAETLAQSVGAPPRPWVSPPCSPAAHHQLFRTLLCLSPDVSARGAHLSRWANHSWRAQRQTLPCWKSVSRVL